MSSLVSDCGTCGGIRLARRATPEQIEWVCGDCGAHDVEERTEA